MELTVSLITQVFVNALIAGGIYSLISVGYNLVYGILRFINFAHGEIVAIGAFAGFAFTSMGFPILAAAFFSIIATSAIGIALEKAVYRPLRDKPRLSLLVAAISLSIVIQAFLLLVFGADVRTMPASSATIKLGAATITQTQILIIFSSFIFVALVEIFLHKTKTGKEIRAAADNPDLAKSIGIDSDRVIMITFAAASALAAIGGMLSAMDHSFDYLMGVSLGIKAFTASVIGGIGSISGSFIGGYVLGIAENFGVLFIPSGYKDAISFFLLILFLLLRPGGIINKEARKA